MRNLITAVVSILDKGSCCISPMLALRLGVAWFFYRSALNKVTQVWPWPEVADMTYQLFETFYQVPLLDPRVAAVIGTWAELIFPILLLVGLATRFTAIALFVFNLVAYLSLPDPNTASVITHLVVYLLMIVAIIVNGPGRVSLDHLLFGKPR